MRIVKVRVTEELLKSRMGLPSSVCIQAIESAPERGEFYVLLAGDGIPDLPSLTDGTIPEARVSVRRQPEFIASWTHSARDSWEIER